VTLSQKERKILYHGMLASPSIGNFLMMPLRQ